MKKAEFDNQAHILRLHIPDEESYGIIDGGHTGFAVRQTVARSRASGIEESPSNMRGFAQVYRACDPAKMVQPLKRCATESNSLRISYDSEMRQHVQDIQGRSAGRESFGGNGPSRM